MRRLKFLVLALLVAGTTAVGITAAVTRTADSEGVSRVERRMMVSWASDCETDNCGIVTTPIAYTTPAAPASVDLTLTVTLDYRTSRRDTARAGVSLDDGTPPFERMRPSYPLTTARTPTTTTLTWMRRDVPAAGKEYTFRLSVAPGDRNSDGGSRVSGTRMTVVIESWTAGD